ncbi:MAG: hypothetical protein M4D80_10470 [Myxococcota bacterium]|nr:hypothetical protein [Myxococcota bacterium]
MLKRLSALGNTRALVLDATTRRIMGIEEDTWLRLTFENDYQRMIVEPVDVDPELDTPRRRTRVRAKEPPKPRFSPALVEARDVVARLQDLNIPEASAQRLLAPMKVWFFYYQLNDSWRDDLNPSDVPRVERVRICCERREAGASWDEAIDAAIAAVPSLHPAGEV